VYNCEFLDIDPDKAFSLKTAMDSRYPYSRHVALQVKQTRFKSTFYSGGFVMPDTPFMRPYEPKGCRDVESGQICDGICMRSVGLSIEGNMAFDRDYTVRVTRDRSGASELIRNPTKVRAGPRPWRFFTALQTGEEYTFELIIPRGAPVPRFVSIDVGDSTKKCTSGDLKINIVQRSFTLDPPVKYRQFAAEHDDCKGPAPTDMGYYRDVCTGGRMERQLVIPPGALPTDVRPNQREISMRANIGTPPCRTKNIC